MAAIPPAGPVARPSIAAHTAANFDKLIDQAYKRKLDRTAPEFWTTTDDTKVDASLAVVKKSSHLTDFFMRAQGMLSSNGKADFNLFFDRTFVPKLHPDDIIGDMANYDETEKTMNEQVCRFICEFLGSGWNSLKKKHLNVRDRDGNMHYGCAITLLDAIKSHVNPNETVNLVNLADSMSTKVDRYADPSVELEKFETLAIAYCAVTGTDMDADVSEIKRFLIQKLAGSPTYHGLMPSLIMSQKTVAELRIQICNYWQLTIKPMAEERKRKDKERNKSGKGKGGKGGGKGGKGGGKGNRNKKYSQHYSHGKAKGGKGGKNNTKHDGNKESTATQLATMRNQITEMAINQSNGGNRAGAQHMQLANTSSDDTGLFSV